MGSEMCIRDRYIHQNYGDRVILSLMNQYTPFERLKEREDCRELCRRVTKREYEAVIEYILSLGMENVFIQEGVTAKESFIPEFDGEGILKRYSLTEPGNFTS